MVALHVAERITAICADAHAVDEHILDVIAAGGGEGEGLALALGHGHDASGRVNAALARDCDGDEAGRDVAVRRLEVQRTGHGVRADGILAHLSAAAPARLGAVDIPAVDSVAAVGEREPGRDIGQEHGRTVIDVQVVAHGRLVVVDLSARPDGHARRGSVYIDPSAADISLAAGYDDVGDVEHGVGVMGLYIYGSAVFGRRAAAYCAAGNVHGYGVIALNIYSAASDPAVMAVSYRAAVHVECRRAHRTSTYGVARRNTHSASGHSRARFYDTAVHVECGKVGHINRTNRRD